MDHDQIKIVPFNKIQGITSNNIPAHSNEYNDFISFDGFYIHGIYTGYKWQCVEFARRWLLLRKSCTFQSFPAAADMWNDLKYVERVTDGRKFSVKTHPNGSLNMPQCDSFLLYPRGKDCPFGHIAVICEVHEDFIRIAEQNYRFHYWSDNYSREIPMVKRDGGYWLEDYYPIYGWIEIEHNEQLKPLNPLRDCILNQYRSLKSIGKFECYTNQSNEIYCKIDEDFLLNLSSISNELYQLFRQTTENVIRNDELLNGFGIPKAFWSRIRQSWNNEQDLDLINYLPLKFNRNKFQLCHYRLDEFFTTLEYVAQQTEKIQCMQLTYEFTSSFQIHHLLVRNWKRLNINQTIHLLIENNDEKMNIIFYMKQVMIEAGIDVKIIRLTEDLFWKNENIIDSDGQTIEIVWKIWNWERIFQNYFNRYTDEYYSRDQHPCLYDILFHSNIRILEPIWKSIINHSTLFPVLYAMYPNHPNILEYDSILSEESYQLPSLDYLINEYNYQTKSTEDFSDKIIVSWMINNFFSGFTVHDYNNPSSTYCCIV